MQYGIILVAGDPRTAAEMAAEAEKAGWDGVFTWDGISVGRFDTYDPWVVMAAMAMCTSLVRLGAIVTPPARRRPWKLAREAMTVDRLSNGRLVLPVGLGAVDDAGFGNVGEPTEARIRAELLDETLAILDGLWSGKPFAFHGSHYQFKKMTFRPTPVQRPRIPIWPVGAWPRPRSMRRTLRWDGVYVQAHGTDGKATNVTPKVVADVAGYGRRERAVNLRERPWDVVVEGTTPADDATAAAAMVRPFADAGATWWIESDWMGGTVDAIRKRIQAGPPRA